MYFGLGDQPPGRSKVRGGEGFNRSSWFGWGASPLRCQVLSLDDDRGDMSKVGDVDDSPDRLVGFTERGARPEAGPASSTTPVPRRCR
jgi:hypothetical protein